MNEYLVKATFDSYRIKYEAMMENATEKYFKKHPDKIEETDENRNNYAS